MSVIVSENENSNSKLVHKRGKSYSNANPSANLSLDQSKQPSKSFYDPYDAKRKTFQDIDIMADSM